MNWIELNNQAPTIGQTVFTWGKQGMRLCVYDYQIGLFGQKKGKPVFGNRMSKFRIVDKDVTHWMPLPIPPKN